ncbi:hypothetical protein ACHAXS_010699, partial [Conticribra weissflogii]
YFQLISGLNLGCLDCVAHSVDAVDVTSFPRNFDGIEVQNDEVSHSCFVFAIRHT